MKSKLILLCGLLTLLVAAQCNPGPLPPPAPVPTVVIADAAPPPLTDAAPAPEPDIDPSVRAACSTLAALQCPEGLAADCRVVLQKAFVQRITIVPLDCLVGATSKPGARACGFVTCP